MLERHAILGYIPAPCHAFIIVSSDTIFAGIGLYCDRLYWEENVVYWYSFICDPLEDIYPRVEVLYVP